MQHAYARRPCCDTKEHELPTRTRGTLESSATSAPQIPGVAAAPLLLLAHFPAAGVLHFNCSLIKDSTNNTQSFSTSYQNRKRFNFGLRV